MNTCKSIALALALIAVGVLAHAGDQKPMSRSETLHTTATVKTIDQATRTLVLKGDESGAEVEVVAGPDVRNLKQIKVGDRVLLTYVVGVAVALKPRGTPASAPAETTSEKRSAPGEKPGGTMGRSVATTVTIESVDTSFNTVTFKRSDGTTRVVSVEDPEAQRFIRTLKPGDSVEIAYTEATAVSVEPAAAH
jgi:hypothetical protein